jgi:hypothetical protein
MRRGFIALAAVVGSLMAVSAAPAMASLHWSDTTKGIKLTGSLTVSEEGRTSKTCSAPSSQASFMEGTFVFIEGPVPSEDLRLSCSGGGTLELVFYANAISTTRVDIIDNGIYPLTQPWAGFYSQFSEERNAVGDFKNGSGSISSTLTFSNDEIGFDLSSTLPIKITGTFKVTTSTGGLLTLVP